MELVVKAVLFDIRIDLYHFRGLCVGNVLIQCFNNEKFGSLCREFCAVDLACGGIIVTCDITCEGFFR